jgi:cytochrome c peroxidase
MSMRRVLPALLLVAVLFAGLAIRARAPSPPQPLRISPELLQRSYLRGLDSLDQALLALLDLPRHPDPLAAQAAFRRARAAYKRIEYRIDFDDRALATTFNGPPLPRPDEDDPATILAPTGLQVIEEVLFPRPVPEFHRVIEPQARRMRLALQQVRSERPDTLDIVRRPFDMARMQLARIATLGIAGFDATRSKEGLRESAEALLGVQEALEVYGEAARARDSSAWQALQAALNAAAAHLRASPDFERFDRFVFLTRFVRPITDQLERLQRVLELPPARLPSPWSGGGADIYAPGAVSAAFFAPDFAPKSTPRLVALGERLFFDRALSLGRQRSCATCHQPARAFTDGRRRAPVDPGHGFVRNTPTLLHAGLQAAQFGDQRARFLEFQAEGVLGNPREMGLPLPAAVARLRSDPAMTRQFAAAFGRPPAEAITEQTLMVVVAAYVRSLGTMNSRFDRAMRGDTAALTGGERRGFNLFMGKAACGTCHFPPLFNGTQPPSYQEAEPEVVGVPARPLSKPAALDPDPGVSAITQAALHRHAFKTPTMRNVAVTSPYMHNGVFRTLDEVVDFYNRGGGAGIGIALPNPTLSPEPLHLRKQEKRDLVAFLESLTDSAFETSAAGAR